MELEQDQQRCLESLVKATKQLHGNVDDIQLARIAELIIQTMTGPWRFFHTPEHIFEVGGVGGAEDPIEVLAALFHDLVYVQVDQGVSVNISYYISPFVKELKGQLFIRDGRELPSDPMFDLVAAIFNFAPGQALAPTAGQNEFLSALIAVKALQSILPHSVLAEIAACIEATIPFRPPYEAGLYAIDLLYQRLIAANQQFEFGWTEAKLLEVVERAVRLANRDVENFAFPNPADFLANTWNLLPETNHHLKNANSYTVQGYRTSIQKMEGFMNFLKPELIFQRFGNEPDEETYHRLIERTRGNLDVAKLYLGTKLVSIAIIEALSLRIGRDVPISTMMGELPSARYLGAQLEQFLPIIPVSHPPASKTERQVLELLEKGRSLDSSYDVKNSPTATFVVKLLGFGKVRELLTKAKMFFKEELSGEEFLDSCDSEVVRIVTDGVIQLFESRKLSIGHLEPETQEAIAS